MLVTCAICGYDFLTEADEVFFHPGHGEKGNWYCARCVGIKAEEREKIKELVSDGHSRHCACRIVWGGEECECGWTEKQEKPYYLVMAFSSSQTIKIGGADVPIDLVWYDGMIGAIPLFDDIEKAKACAALQKHKTIIHAVRIVRG